MWASVSICHSGGVITVTKKKINNAQEDHNTKKTISRIRTKHHHGYHHHCFGYLPKLHHQLSSQSSSSSSSLNCSSTNYGAAEENNLLIAEPYQQSEKKGLWQNWREKSGEMSSKLAKLGLSAVLAYGLFDAVTYTSFFVLAFLGYEKSTGQNPAANLKALIGIVILMWTGNNVTRPFRVAGAAALAPFIDKGLKQIQKYFNFPSIFNAFALVVGIVAAPCLAVVGLLILSRLGK